jgi:hypothetical protein
VTPPSTTVYFDTEDEANCLALLPTELRVSEDLVFLAAQCEADVLNTFTRRVNTTSYTNFPIAATLPVAFRSTSVYTDLGNGLGVFLAGYTVDPTQCEDPLFVTAMRRTVAEVYRWRYQQNRRDVQVKQLSGGSGTASSGQKTFIGYDSLPPAWDRYLKPYDTRETDGAI